MLTHTHCTFLSQARTTHCYVFCDVGTVTIKSLVVCVLLVVRQFVSAAVCGGHTSKGPSVSLPRLEDNVFLCYTCFIGARARDYGLLLQR